MADQQKKKELLDMVSSNKGKTNQTEDHEEIYKKQEFVRKEKERLTQEQNDKEDIKKMDLIKKIRQYYTAFPFVTECAPKTKLEKMSMIQLDQEMKRIISNLNAKSALETVQKIDYALNWFGEKILIANHVPVHGLSAFVRSEEGLEMMAQEHKEFALEYEDWLGSSKELRYFMKSFQRIILIIEMNKRIMSTANNVSPETEEKFNDL